MDDRGDSNGRSADDHDEPTPDELDAEVVISSPADIESAGRSCMAILVLAAIIFLLLCVWIGLRSTGAGQ